MARLTVRVGWIAALALGAWLGLAAVSPDATPDALEQPVSVTVRPTIMIARGVIRAEIRVPRDVDNRRLVLSWASLHASGESQWPLDGDASEMLFVRELPDQVPGDYVFLASLYGQRGELRGRAVAQVHDPADGGEGR